MNIKGQVKFVDKEKNLFFSTLKRRVDDYFTVNHISKHANATMIIKTISLLLMYIGPYLMIVLVQPSFLIMNLLWLVMGFGLAGIGMSIMHDANHGAYSSNKFVNYLMGHTLNFVGGSVFNWKLQHNILHHTYTNVAHMDDDIDDKLVLRFNPHTKVKSYQKLQYIYAFLFYGILTIYWALLKDFIQFAKYTKNGVNPSTKKENAIILIRMTIDKIFYFFISIGIPVMAGIPFWYVFTGFMIMHFAAGIILTVVFQLAHTVEGTTHPLPNENGDIENCWAIHQMNTTVNFSRGSKILTWYLGGLNYQVEHHLFPRICHVHYPKIAPIVKQTAEEFGVPYMENETFGIAFRSHMNTLKRFGRLPDINEAIA
ncbi:MAG TPA: acyl-CoA desaturase [Bacteroidia bacterium]|nr:acyl-CoA desaturase [Bacteroidia bacterium]